MPRVFSFKDYQVTEHVKDELSSLGFELVDLKLKDHVFEYLRIHEGLLLFLSKIKLSCYRLLQEFSKIIESLHFSNTID